MISQKSRQFNFFLGIDLLRIWEYSTSLQSTRTIIGFKIL